ncbi:MAG: hypothetical protein P9F19_13040 [Candidatus Contendobacter sp.]|nr:hypothetical protein [Candidatus Contendobacter sp.]MDG4558297.1 hypothetical protein [Candidatus Contendobacter sp.]
MASNVISLEQVLSHLENRIPNTSNCKKQLIDLVRWIISWNPDRLLNNQVFSFIREDVNIAFALDRDSNQLKTRKPNFFVIKLPRTDREFKDIHADFDLTESGYPLLSQYLIQRPSNPPRWVSLCGHISEMSFANFQKLFLIAYERKGGII